MRSVSNMVTRVQATYQYAPASLGSASYGTPVARSLAETNVYLSAGYTYTGMGYVKQQRTRVEIDLNVRVRGNDTFVGFEDLSGPVAVGELVEVYESESGVAGEGRITEIDGDRELVYLSVDWTSLSEAYTSTYQGVSTALPQLLFVGANMATVTSFQEPWAELVARPSLVSLGVDRGTIWITAPIYETPGGALDIFNTNYFDTQNITMNFGNDIGVAA
jgi:hypothetical protein